MSTKPFPCLLCPKTYLTRKSLLAHETKKHLHNHVVPHSLGFELSFKLVLVPVSVSFSCECKVPSSYLPNIPRSQAIHFTLPQKPFLLCFLPRARFRILTSSVKM